MGGYSRRHVHRRHHAVCRRSIDGRDPSAIAGRGQGRECRSTVRRDRIGEGRVRFERPGLGHGGREESGRRERPVNHQRRPVRERLDDQDQVDGRCNDRASANIGAVREAARGTLISGGGHDCDSKSSAHAWRPANGRGSCGRVAGIGD